VFPLCRKMFYRHTPLLPGNGTFKGKQKWHPIKR
jgi:hypothetical protein